MDPDSPQVDDSLPGGAMSEEDFSTGGLPASETDSPASSPVTQEPQLASDTSVVTPTAEAEPTTQTVVDAIRSLGFDLPSDVTDMSAIATLAQRAREAERLRAQIQSQEYYTRLGQQVGQLPPDRLQGLMRPSAQQAQPDQRPAWEPPPFDESTLPLLDRDESTGLFVPKPGVPQEYATKANDRDRWLRDFMRNPTQVFKQFADHTFKIQFDAEFNARYQALQQQQDVERIRQANAPWVYQIDPATNTPLVANGQPVLSHAGVLYSQALITLGQAGVKSPATMDDIARQMVHAQLAAYQQANANRSAAVTPRQQQALAASTPTVNPLQSMSVVGRDQTPGATNPNTDGLSLRERLMRNMQAAGITDQDLTPESFGP